MWYYRGAKRISNLVYCVSSRSAGNDWCQTFAQPHPKDREIGRRNAYWERSATFRISILHSKALLVRAIVRRGRCESRVAKNLCICGSVSVRGRSSIVNSMSRLRKHNSINLLLSFGFFSFWPLPPPTSPVLLFFSFLRKHAMRCVTCDIYLNMLTSYKKKKREKKINEKKTRRK